jgi:hypothetical protein
MRRLFVLAISIAMFGTLALPVSAASGTGPPPIPTCYPGVGPCQETDHFGQLTFLGSPLPGCGGIFNEWALIDQRGNGVEHINVNNAQDAWFTTTMVGASTLVLGTVTFDINGNPTFTPDPTKPTYAGHGQQWFGGQLNNKNASMSFTANFQMSATDGSGSSLSLHLDSHVNSTGNAPFTPNPNSMHFNVSCH